MLAHTTDVPHLLPLTACPYSYLAPSSPQHAQPLCLCYLCQSGTVLNLWGPALSLTPWRSPRLCLRRQCLPGCGWGAHCGADEWWLCSHSFIHWNTSWLFYFWLHVITNKTLINTYRYFVILFWTGLPTTSYDKVVCSLFYFLITYDLLTSVSRAWCSLSRTIIWGSIL